MFLKSLAVLTSLPVLAAAQQNAMIVTIPKFYSSADCSGDVDPESHLWSASATNGDVAPFKDHDFIQGWMINRCLTHSTLQYSIKLKLNADACEPSGDKAKQATIEYYGTSQNCSGTPIRTHMSLPCMRYPLGSIKFEPNLSPDDLCIVTRHEEALREGGIIHEVWVNTNCSDPLYSTTLVQHAPLTCANDPHCTGCCREFKQDTCSYSSSFKRSMAACRKVGNTYQYATSELVYADEKCTERVTSLWDATVHYEGGCATTLFEGEHDISFRFSLKAPLTEEIACEFLELQMREKLTATGVSWDELHGKESESGSVGTPRVSLAVVLLVALLLL
eukprot:TRINITY_DN23390_c0_g1_i1.p1 TRINITY_DN23390_c0_g1~~TRINITY_DN23390_c0_g1_i1.p1  ORF type:complete len:359 (+),score=67.29 TRINITY_DN23390_c0_g1_i1:77-1078(+)